MKYFILLISVIFIFGCKPKNNTDLDINKENVIEKISSEELRSSKIRFNRFMENIEGYYTVDAGIFNDRYTYYLIHITIEENELILSKFNIVNAQHISEELTRFDIHTNDRTDSIHLTNDNYNFWVSFDYHNTIHHISLFLNWDTDGRRGTSFTPRAKEIDERLIQYTYDYQKKYVGVYQWDSVALNGITEDDYNKKHKVNEMILNIDKNGNLFLANKDGSEKYDFPKTFIINEKASLFGHNPGSGAFSIGIYYSDGVIYYSYENFYIRENGEYKDCKYSVLAAYKRY